MRLWLVLAVAGVMLVLPSAAAAQAQGDAVTVNGTLYSGPIDDFDTSSAILDARSGPSGENPTGTFLAHFGGGLGLNFEGRVTCLAVNGNRAVIGVEGFRLGAFPEPFGGLIVATDGGPAVTQPPWRDTFDFEAFAPPGPTNCSLTPPVLSFRNWVANLTVIDATPSPTSKEQCKHGGWAQFGFKNQGQCVAFVQRGPKP
jgi:hypothetical protein